MALNINNRTLFCNDNINVLQGINSDCIDLIYLDPPFNKNKVFTAPIGSASEGASFSDIFREEDVKDEWLDTIREDNPKLNIFLESVKIIEGRTSYNFCYLAYMAIRLIEMRRILKDTGSLYLHCDPTMSHYIKILLDILFGEKNFRNEIVWKRTYAHNDGKRFGRVKDCIFFYTKSNTYFYQSIVLPYDDSYVDDNFRSEDERGAYQSVTLTGPGLNPNDPEFMGYHPKTSGRSWSVPKRVVNKLVGEQKAKTMSIVERLQLLYDNDYILISKNGVLRFKSYLDDLDGVAAQDLWYDINPASGDEYLGYPTQKPVALLERIITASCPEDGVVLDPFCGCATTCVASEKLGRQWIGIDVSIKAYELVKKRLKREVTDIETRGLFAEKEDSIHVFTTPPKRTDQGDDYREKKYVYIISNPQYPNDYKVGIAKDWKSRLNSYQTSDPERSYTMEYKILTPVFRAMEKHIHETFENNHEWVRGDLKDIIKAMEKYDKEQT